MLYSVRGKVIDFEPGRLHLQVDSFVFELLIPLSFTPKQGTEIQLFTLLFIREEEMVLYGFSSELERKFFQLALTVPGVGPKLGLSLLGGMSLPELATRIRDGDLRALEKISGVGKKLAQRLVGDLRDKVGFLVSVPGGVKAQAVDLLVDLGLSAEQARKTVESIAKANCTAAELVDLSLRKLGDGTRS